MTTQVTAQDEQTRRGLGTLIGMTAVTLAVLGAVALWQLRPGDEGASPRTTTAAATDDALPRVSSPGTASEPFSVFLVANEAQVGTLAHEYEVLIDGNGLPARDPRRMQVIVVRTAADLELVREHLELLRALGEERVQVIDRTARAVSAGSESRCGLDTLRRDC